MFRLVGGPESQIVSEKLHDECAIFVALFGQCVKLGYSVIKCLGGKRKGMEGKGVRESVCGGREGQEGRGGE